MALFGACQSPTGIFRNNASYFAQPCECPAAVWAVLSVASAISAILRSIVNPLAPIPRGFGVNLTDPATGQPVYYDGSPQPLYGYGGFIRNTTAADGPRSFRISILAGTGGPYCFNHILITTAAHVTPDPDIVSYRVFKGIVLALAEAFEPANAMAYPSSVLDLWPIGKTSAPAIKLAWITYAAPRYAHLITPPATAIVEYRPNGGLLMAATEATFDVRNQAHMAVARDIEATAAPFNVFMQQEWADIIAKGYQ